MFLKSFFKSRAPDDIVLFLIGVFSYLYSLYGADFAELNIFFSFLGFPVFVGEILLFLCLIVFLIKSLTKSIDVRRFSVWIIFYLVWLLAKAFHGYFTFGPLAFRNAALFYYPLFALVTYTFYRKTFFTERVNLFLFFVLMVTLSTGAVFDYFIVTYLSLGLILVFGVERKWLKYVLLFLLLLSLAIRSLSIVQQSRSHLVGVFCSFSFIFLVYFTYFFGRFRRREVYSFFLLVIVILVSVVIKFGDRNVLTTTFNMKRISEDIFYYDAFVRDQMECYHPREISPNLYRKNKPVNFLSRFSSGEKPPEFPMVRDKIKEINEEKLKTLQGNAREEITQKLVLLFLQGNIGRVPGEREKKTWARLESVTKDINELMVSVDQSQQGKEIPSEASESTTSFSQEKQADVQKLSLKISRKLEELVVLADPPRGEVYDQHVKDRAWGIVKNIRTDPQTIYPLIFEVKEFRPPLSRPMDIAYSNIIFRLLIWKDMVIDLIHEKAFLGVNFGKPQRSNSIEVLLWAYDQWTRDGWITPHNVSLHVIYRAGIVGLGLLVLLLSVLVQAIKTFIKWKSLIGILLISIFIYWLVLSSFLVILEFPHYAIPFWSLFGLMLAYKRDLEKHL